MPKITFHGLCGFARRENDKEVRVLMPEAPDHHGAGHLAYMLIDLDDLNDVEPVEPKWNPDDVLPSPNGKQIGKWLLAGLELSAGAVDKVPTLPNDLISLRDLHGLTKPAVLNGGAEMSLKGGKMKKDKEYPAKLNIIKAKGSATQVGPKDYTEVVEWRSDALVISSGARSITLKNDDIDVAITNAVPGFSPQHQGLEHFVGYYTTLAAVKEDDQLKLIVDNGQAPAIAILSAGAGNCVPNVELP